MKGFLKVIGSNNQILPVGAEYNAAKLITNKLIVYQVVGKLDRKVLTLDIKNVNILDECVHVDAWFADAEHNGGRVEFELFWK
jgi:hypothetical protein|tara:strand:+ start:43 stop:291 length:249 start_codon:yes stop_codon:yes gene_type:complete